MNRKLIASVLAAVLSLGFLQKASAHGSDGDAELRSRICSDYDETLAATEKESLGGYCGLMTSWQLYFMGINRQVIPADGNKQFDLYRNMKKTTGGYTVHPYPAESDTLEQALRRISQNGTRDVYNILVGFETTTTEAGAQYGHSVVIYGILDGMVYFTESFQTSFGPGAGEVNRVTIRQFANYYANWMEYEGLIHFEKETYLDKCRAYPANLFVETTYPAELLTEPYPVQQQEVSSKCSRIAAKGERLWVTGLYENTAGVYYYQVVDSGQVRYVEAVCTELLQFNEQEDIQLIPPEKPARKASWQPRGTIKSAHAAMRAIRIQVADSAERPVGSYALMKQSEYYSLEEPDIQKLLADCPGYSDYTYGLSVDAYNCYVKDGNLCTDVRTVPVQLSVPDARMAAAAVKEYEDGWTYEGGRWYFYRDGKPVKGWLTYKNVSYYLDSSGAAMTGWQEIRGKKCFFTDTGAMCTAPQPAK